MDGTFRESATRVGLDAGRNELGLLTFDFDNDGDRDVVITAYNDALQLYGNELAGPETGWLRVRLDTHQTADLAPNGWGARVTVRAGGKSLTRYQT